MAGDLVPLVLIPRYTSLAGLMGSGSEFTTTPIDVTPYQTALVTVYRGVVVGTNPAPATPPTPVVKLWLEESTDQSVWSPTGPTGFDPGTLVTDSVGPPLVQHYAAGQTQYIVTLGRRWFRMRVVLFNANNVVSCYATGFLERRLR